VKYLIAFVTSIFLFNFFMGCTVLSAPDGEDTVVAVGLGDTQKPSEKVPAAEAEDIMPQIFEPGSLEDPEICSTCHRDIYNEWSKSMHANAWEDKWYQPDYILAHQQTDGATDLLCGACHAPVAARTGLLPPADGSQFDATSRRGISCDFCHTVSGVGLMFFADEPLRVRVEFADSDGTVRVHTGRLVRTQKMTERTTGFAIEFDPE